MNQIILCGRLTREPETRYTQNDNPMVRYTLAVDRRRSENTTDYFNIIAFDKRAEFASKYFHQGMRVLVQGHVQTGSYINKDGIKVNTFDIYAENQEFADGKQERRESRENDPDRFLDFDEYDTHGEHGIPF